ncbi:MAG TPA: hypothetical protein VEM96_11440 [Pyrinomonadaceae bacterium]|nr:hypothetical protein [Pyrinomonadaceae bacterium]
MRLRATYALAFVFLVAPLQVTAQSTSQSPPQTPSEAYERATQPLRDFEKSAEPTIEANAQAWKEHEQRARSYAVLFKVEGWKGEQLLSLAQLYAAAGQSNNAERAYVLYLKDSKATHPTLARKGLIDVLLAQEKWKDAVAVARELLEEPKYDQEIILNVYAHAFYCLHFGGGRYIPAVFNSTLSRAVTAGGYLLLRGNQFYRLRLL